MFKHVSVLVTHDMSALKIILLTYLLTYLLQVANSVVDAGVIIIIIIIDMSGSPTSCSSSCPWHCRGGMRSHFKTRSLPASSLQSVVSYFSVLVPTGFVLVGQKNNNNNTNICKAHIVSIRAESEAPAVARWRG